MMGELHNSGPLRLIAASALVLAIAACDSERSPRSVARLAVADVLGGDVTLGFERALEPRDFLFPADHGPHPRFRSEWWYFTGNLDSTAGRHFGYQLTIFRTALAPPGVEIAGSSAWRTREIYMAHFAVTDVRGERFFAFDRFGRGALGLAGAQADPWRVWLDDWSLEQVGPDPFPLRLRAREGTAAGGDGGDEIAIDLTVAPTKPVVLQGDRGLSKKGTAAGNASYYYSFTRLDTVGAVRLGGEEHAVTGSSWLDREWSTSALEEGQVGWDWFALQLSDGSDLTFYRIRHDDGGASPERAGTLVAPDGTAISLSRGEVELEVVRMWRSPRDGTAYPVEWRISVPSRGISLDIEPYLDEQELDLAFRYWEGAVRVRGESGTGRAVDGSGYVELTGYAGGARHP